MFANPHITIQTHLQHTSAVYIWCCITDYRLAGQSVGDNPQLPLVICVSYRNHCYVCCRRGSGCATNLMVRHLMSPDKEQNTLIVINPIAVLVFLFHGPGLPRRHISHQFTVSCGDTRRTCATGRIAGKRTTAAIDGVRWMHFGRGWQIF